MRILVLTPQVPRFPGPGGETRQFCLLRELARQHEFTVVPLAWPNTRGFLPQLMELPIRVVPVFLGEQAGDSSPTPSSRASARRRVASRYPRLAAGYRRTRMGWRAATECLRVLAPTPRMLDGTRAVAQEVRRALQGFRLEEFDLIQVEHVKAGLWLRGIAAQVPRLLVCLDIASVLARREFEHQRWLEGRLAAFAEWRKVQRYERRIAQTFDNCVVMSEVDQAALRALDSSVRTWVVPNGVDTGHFQPADPESVEADSMVFTGTMFWGPNVDATIHFCGDILPLIQRQYSGVRLTIVGAEPTEAVRRLGEQRGVTVTGSVKDVRQYIGRAAVVIAPIRLGSGTRLKILEAMAMGKAVVSTSVGCEGLEVTPGKDIEVADSPEAFAVAVCRLLGDSARRRALGEAGRRLVTDRYDWRIIARQQDAVYAALAEGPRSR